MFFNYSLIYEVLINGVVDVNNNDDISGGSNK